MVSLCLDDKVTESSKEDIKEFFWSAQLCSYRLYMKHNEGPPCHCHLWETHQTVNHRTNREIARWDTKERCYVSLQWFFNIEMGCIMGGFIYDVNVFERSSFICQYVLYTWVERWRLAVESMWPLCLLFLFPCDCLLYPALAFFSGGRSELVLRVLGSRDNKEQFLKRVS